MATFSLEPQTPGRSPAGTSEGAGLCAAILLQDARWFTRIRWFVVVLLLGFGILSALFPAALQSVSIRPVSVWPWSLALALVLTNLLTIRWLNRLSPEVSRRTIETNIAFQISSDLLLLTILVYLTGAVDTILPFAYLFHIALACIFFDRRKSFVVSLSAALLYLAASGITQLSSEHHPTVLLHARRHTPQEAVLATQVLPTVLIWFGVWYLVSTLSGMVRKKDAALDALNKSLLRADEEKNRQMLRVTHDLKSPFADIENNIQILKLSYWDTIPRKAQAIIERIEAKGEILRTRIGDTLELGSLRSGEDSAVREAVNLTALLNDMLQDVQGLTRQRKVSISVTGDFGKTIQGDRRQLRILLLNLITNAVTYSHEGGNVVIDVTSDVPAGIRVIDHGIGITEEALPHIFKDFFHASEATRVNARSTGLGLAIVRQVAQNLGITISVESHPGEGSVFDVRFPPAL